MASAIRSNVLQGCMEQSTEYQYPIPEPSRLPDFANPFRASPVPQWLNIAPFSAVRSYPGSTMIRSLYHE
ncbi:hypothetical protein VTN00DRAFT_165 [Thermoascus crustaceus]|uniref:uncharacterized protein n=1 Tax=Thermoascus crustaceus TaxID=5088 RepID=UPI0037424C56